MTDTKKMRCLAGAYAGEIREYPTLVAQQLEADGRAQDPNAPWEPATATSPEVDFEAHNEQVQERKLEAMRERHRKGRKGKSKGLSTKDL
jgi:hypothetical protein